MSQACSERLCRILCVTKPLIIAGYVSIKGEMDIKPALIELAGKGHPILLPAIDKNHLIFKQCKPGETLSSGIYGTQEPPVLALEYIPQVVIVPLVAFDRKGMRLGYGKGYYDAALRRLRSNNPSLLAIGVGFSCQEEDALPADAHDERLDSIVTEKELITIL